MDLGSAVRVLLRRWVVLVVGVVLTLGMTAFVYLQSPPRYQATASMILLLQPTARDTEGAGSPFLYLPNGLQVLATIVIAGPESREFRQGLLDEGLSSQFELGLQVGSPIITVSVEGLDADNVIATRNKVIEGLQVELATVQREERTPTRQTAHTRVYASEDTPTLIQGNRTRGMLMALGVGGLLTLLATFAIDRGALLLGEWRRRRAEDSRGADTDAAGTNTSEQADANDPSRRLADDSVHESDVLRSTGFSTDSTSGEIGIKAADDDEAEKSPGASDAEASNSPQA